METFEKLFQRFLVFVYHCFDRIVIQGYLPLLTRPEHVVHFFRDVHGQYPITPQVLATHLRIPGLRRALRAPPSNPPPESREGCEHEDMVRPHQAVLTAFTNRHACHSWMVVQRQEVTSLQRY
jgi:hypothetical protein